MSYPGSAFIIYLAQNFTPDVIVGSVAEWSKALVLGTSLFGGVGSNPTAAKNFDNPSNFED